MIIKNRPQKLPKNWATYTIKILPKHLKMSLNHPIGHKIAKLVNNSKRFVKAIVLIQ